MLKSAVDALDLHFPKVTTSSAPSWGRHRMLEKEK
jgi:hypothetical protein